MSAGSKLLEGADFLHKGDEGLKGAGFLNNRAKRSASHVDIAIKPFIYVVMALRADLGAISCHEEAQMFLPTFAFRLLCQASPQANVLLNLDQVVAVYCVHFPEYRLEVIPTCP